MIRFPRKTIAAAFMLALLIAWSLAAVPAVLPVAYAVMSLLAFVTYAVDKSAATRSQWRTPESTLHLIGLLGGWPGALFAQDLLRHKSSKQEFQWVFFATVILNLVALAWLLVSGSVNSLNRALFGI